MKASSGPEDDFTVQPLRVAAHPALAPRLAGLLSGRPGALIVVGVADAADIDPEAANADDAVLLLSTEVAIEPDELALLAARRPVVMHLANAAIREAALVELWQGAIRAGVQDVLFDADLATPAGALRLHAAAQRHRATHQARTAYATDLSTGLPHRQQLLEHMSQLLALRRREPAPMAVLVLHLGGSTPALAQFGAGAAAALRRKLAVRLRSGLRASDVVASLEEADFAVLLASVEAPAHVDGVVAKLIALARRPLLLAGQSVSVEFSAGVARYPDDGDDAGVLLQHALHRAHHEPDAGVRVEAANDPAR